jgi:hypothetical protein
VLLPVKLAKHFFAFTTPIVAPQPLSVPQNQPTPQAASALTIPGLNKLKPIKTKTKLKTKNNLFIFTSITGSERPE